MSKKSVAAGGFNMHHDDHGLSKKMKGLAKNPSPKMLNLLDDFVDKYPDLFETQVSNDEVAETMSEDADFMTDVIEALAEELPDLSDYDAADMEYACDNLYDDDNFVGELAQLVNE